MAALRPIPVDPMPGDGWPVVATHLTCFQDPLARPCRRPATHSFAVLTFFTGGQARVEQNGQWELAAGDALLIPAGQPHRLLETRRPDCWGLSFCVPCVAGDEAAALLTPFEKVRDGGSAVVSIPAGRHGFLEGLFRELSALGSASRCGTEARAAVQRSLLTLILNEVERAAAAVDPGARSSGGGVVTESLRFIERNCLRRLTLGDVAAAVGRSPAYVTAALSQATGRSAGQWIVSGRMAEARRLLLHSSDPVDVIAERVGYADSTHFIRMFRREHGATPAAWRAARLR
ncbi:MAG: AraC family transcriptional regulator [Polyangia bacterium]